MVLFTHVSVWWVGILVMTSMVSVGLGYVLLVGLVVGVRVVGLV